MIFVCVITTSFGQKSTKSFFFSPTKFGIQFTQGNENNFLFDDTDYFYQSNTIKGQFFYPLTQLGTVAISLVIQPQIQFVQHQLYNEHFVKPEEVNFVLKRQRFTKLKNLSITGIEFSIEAKQQIYRRFSMYIQIGLGFAYIDKETERLAKGFTFIENGNLGMSYRLNTNTSIRLFNGLGHVSNFDFQRPNSGYNIFNTGVSIQYSLK